MTEVDDTLSDSGSDTAASFRRSTRVRRPNRRYQNDDFEVELPASLVIEVVNFVTEPQSVQEALASHDADNWKETLDKEYSDLMSNNTWKLVDVMHMEMPYDIAPGSLSKDVSNATGLTTGKHTLLWLLKKL
ncbi:hypothetical protein PHMEG_00018395 [Phytophthora megakarya]|uniref:Uncharacterized protein n=1 Tax=Phytophthora megakarya TaxID=4795 RepID=A0A225VUZ8_9STRA|nr:hypothetical protein PHMEG_00018395 [Phytophthora megakarya]